jgi:hypothetical protein
MTTVRTDADPEVLARAALLAWLDETTLELVPVAGLPELTHTAQLYVETFMRTQLQTSVSWVRTVAEFTPDYEEVAA